MKGISILGYAFIAAGVLMVFWARSIFSGSILNKDAMILLTGASLLVFLGTLIIKDMPKWVAVVMLFLTLLLLVLCMAVLQLRSWFLGLGILVMVGLAWWLTLKILNIWARG